MTGDESNPYRNSNANATKREQPTDIATMMCLSENRMIESDDKGMVHGNGGYPDRRTQKIKWASRKKGMYKGATPLRCPSQAKKGPCYRSHHQDKLVFPPQFLRGCRATDRV
jgi:hypothetical protein